LGGLSHGGRAQVDGGDVLGEAGQSRSGSRGDSRASVREGKSTWPCHTGGAGDWDGPHCCGVETVVRSESMGTLASVGTGRTVPLGEVGMVKYGRAGGGGRCLASEPSWPHGGMGMLQLPGCTLQQASRYIPFYLF
jgi:hypothetical protein